MNNELSMDQSLAADIVGSLCLLSEQVHRPLERCTPDISAEDQKKLRKHVTDVWGEAFFEAMPPIIRQFPDLDPDRPNNRLLVTTNDSVPPSPPGCSRKEFSVLLSEAAEEAALTLERIASRVRSSLPPEQARDLGRRFNSIGARIKALSRLSEEWATRC